MKAKALFLDRDGVINHEINYLHKIEDFRFVEGIFDLCRNFQRNNFLLFVITNQAGIARGYYTEQDFTVLTEWMITKFREQGILITKVYYCPHHPEITGECSCRKPHPGMIMQAEQEFNLNLAWSVLIGDKISDIEAGKNAGVGINILVKPDSIPECLTTFFNKKD